MIETNTFFKKGETYSVSLFDKISNQSFVHDLKVARRTDKTLTDVWGTTYDINIETRHDGSTFEWVEFIIPLGGADSPHRWKSDNAKESDESGQPISYL
jgi:hypothetical protein